MHLNYTDHKGLLNEIFEYNVLRINLAIFGKVFLSIIHYLEYPINR